MGDLKHIGVTIAEIRAAYPGLAHAYEKSRAIDPAKAEWLDGPGVAVWLEAHGVTKDWLETRLPSQARALRRWETGRAASIKNVDAILIETDYTLYDIPADLWIAAPARKRPHSLSPKQKAEAIKRARKGECLEDLAREYNVVSRTLRKWVRESDLGQAA